MTAFVLVKDQCVGCYKFLIGPVCSTCGQLVCGYCQRDHETAEREPAVGEAAP